MLLNNPNAVTQFDIPDEVYDLMTSKLNCILEGSSNSGLRWVNKKKNIPNVFFERIKEETLTITILPTTKDRNINNIEILQRLLINTSIRKSQLYFLEGKQKNILSIKNVSWSHANEILPLLVDWTNSRHNNKYEYYEPTENYSDYISQSNEIIEFIKYPPKGNEVPEIIENSITIFKRDPNVRAYVIKRANYHCELCGTDKTFLTENNRKYFEVHHLIPLSQGGADTIMNTVCLCANCHREIHYGKNANERTIFLLTLLKRYSNIHLTTAST